MSLTFWQDTVICCATCNLAKVAQSAAKRHLCIGRQCLATGDTPFNQPKSVLSQAMPLKLGTVSDCIRQNCSLDWVADRPSQDALQGGMLHER